MSQIKGKLIECCRCKKRLFIAQTGVDEYDGGFTQIETYEKKPEGWTVGREIGINDLCPECSAEWEQVIAKFMKYPI